MNDLISRQTAIAYAISGKTREFDGDKWIRVSEVRKSLKTMPSTQSSKIQDILDYLDTALHPIISPEYWNVYSELYDMVSTLPSTEKWIPVTERLPEEIYDSYWVCTDSGYQCECRWTNINPFWSHLTTTWHWNIFDIPQYSKVIAWMPLPEPYMEAYMVDMSEEEE